MLFVVAENLKDGGAATTRPSVVKISMIPQGRAAGLRALCRNEIPPIFRLDSTLLSAQSWRRCGWLKKGIC